MSVFVILIVLAAGCAVASLVVQPIDGFPGRMWLAVSVFLICVALLIAR